MSSRMAMPTAAKGFAVRASSRGLQDGQSRQFSNQAVAPNVTAFAALKKLQML